MVEDSKMKKDEGLVARVKYGGVEQRVLEDPRLAVRLHPSCCLPELLIGRNKPTQQAQSQLNTMLTLSQDCRECALSVL